MRRIVLLLALALLCSGASEPSGESLLHAATGKVDALYLHPGAVDVPSMLRGGVQQLERHSPDLLVLDDSSTTVEVVSGDRSRIFRTDDVSTLPEAAARIDQVIAFLVEGRGEDDALEAEDLEIQAMKGILRTIDRHSRMVVGDGLDDFNTRYKGTLVGIGARIGRRGGALKVVQPLDGAPASRAGLQSEDLISHIDGHPTTAMSVDAAVDRIRGPEGVPVVLTIARPGEDGRRVFVIVREKVLVASVEKELLPGGVALIQIDHFSQKTAGEVSSALDELKAEAGELQGVILDLRGNTGGSMRRSARIVNFFVDEGTLLRTEGSDGRPVKQLTSDITADARYMRYDGPVAVLVNRRTASGSEILVAGGLKFLDRAVTIGTQTFGKGTVQKVYKLDPSYDNGRGASMKLTVARWLLPGDAFINSVGVTPDIAVGRIWLDPLEPTLPDILREPDTNAGREVGEGGLDGRRNPGGGRAPTRDGANAEPVHRLWYPRIAEDWAGPEATPAEPEDEAEATPAAAPDPPGWSSLEGDAGEPLFNDMELRLAHELLLQAGRGDRRDELVAAAGPIVAEWQQLQADRMAAATDVRGLAWSQGPAPMWMDRSPRREPALQERLAGAPPEGLEVTLHLPERFEAGESTSIKLEVKNSRPSAVKHLRAVVESSTKILDDASFLIGDLEPGQTGSWSVPVDVSGSAATRLDSWRVYLLDDSGPLGGPASGTANTRGGALPNLRLHASVVAEPQPDGSTLLIATVKVRNDGEGTTGEVQVNFGEPQVEGVERMERFDSVDELGPGVSGEVTLRLRVRNPQLTVVPIRLRGRDRRSGAATTVSLEIPLSAPLDTGWLLPAAVMMSAPPDAPRSPPARGGADFRVRGSASAAQALESVEVSVGGDKIFSRRPAGAATEVAFDAPARLEHGPNLVRVKAITSDGVEITRSYWVFGEDS